MNVSNQVWLMQNYSVETVRRSLRKALIDQTPLFNKKKPTKVSVDICAQELKFRDGHKIGLIKKVPYQVNKLLVLSKAIHVYIKRYKALFSTVAILSLSRCS